MIGGSSIAVNVLNINDNKFYVMCFLPQLKTIVI